MQSPKAHIRIVLYSILFLFFFQLLSDLFEAVYAFGLLGTGIPVEIVTLVVLFSPVVLFFYRRRLPHWVLLLLGCGVLVSRVVEAMLDTRGRMIVSGLGVGCFLAFFPALLCARDRDTPGASTLGGALTIGVGLSGLFRVLGSGTDLSTYGGFQAIGWGLAIIPSILLFAARKPRQTMADAEAVDDGERPGLGKAIVLSLGVTSAWLILCLCFAAPNVIARWTGASYELVIGLTALSLCAFSLGAAYLARLPVLLSRKMVVAWNALFVLAMVLTILAHQVAFPTNPDAYPLYELPVPLLHRVPLWGMLLLFPVVLIDWIYLVRELWSLRQAPRVLGASFALSSLFLLVVVLGQVFTTVYDYVPVVGPFFRDKFWLVHLVPGVVLTLSLLLLRRETFARAWSVRGDRLFPAAALLIGLATVVGVVLTAPRPAVPPEQQARLRVCTYNIQQGYDENGSRNYLGQLELLRETGADVIGLQESDTNRVAGGNADIVRYFASKLNMHSYYGPKTVPGTFGIALLSRYPIEKAGTFYMYSAGEQTATIAAQIRVGAQVVDLSVTHLGNGGPIVQQEAILKEVAGKGNVVLMGDFNFWPDSVQYRLTTAALDDAWLLRWPQGTDDQGRRFDRRIDHVYISPGMSATDAQYLTDPESDHPALVVAIQWK